MNALLGGVLAAALGGALAALGLGASRRLLPDAPGAVRLAGALVAAAGVAVGLFHALSPLRLFGLPVLLPLLGLGALAAWPRGGAPPAAPLPGPAALAERLGTGMEARLATGFGLLAGASALRALLLPPAAWDSLVYHLVMAAGMVQTAGRYELAAPGGTGFYLHFPSHAEILQAYALLPLGRDLLVGLVGFGAGALALLALEALARELGATPSDATTACLGLAAVPTFLALLPTAYVEVPQLAFTLAAALFAVRFRRTGRTGDAALAGVGLGLAAGTKLLALAPVAVLALALVLPGPAPARPGARVLGLGLALALGAPGYLETWARTGSPFFPFVPEAPVITTSFAALRAELAGRPGELACLAQVLGLANGALGPLGLVVLFLARPILAAARRDPGRAGLVLAAGLVALGLYASPAADLTRRYWTESAGRFLLAPAGLLVALAATDPGPRGRTALRAATLLGLLGGLPRGWWIPEALAIPLAALVLAGLVRLVRAGPAAALAAALLGLGGLDAAREALRHRAYPALYDLHAFHGAHRSAAALWARFDQPDQPRVIALAGGWRSTWQAYPLMGSRLQNTLEYVPVTRDGSLVEMDDPERLRTRAHLPSWLAGLAARRVDVLVCSPPAGLEERWAALLPRVFEKVGDGPTVAYRIRQDELAALLAGR